MTYIVNLRPISYIKEGSIIIIIYFGCLETDIQRNNYLIIILISKMVYFMIIVLNIVQ